MDYMRYHRYVVLLNGENRQFSLRNDSCKGHLKIETGNNKGALRCRVENLKPMQKNEYVYKLIFFGKKRERTIFAVIGSLNTGRSGTGESYFRFDPTDVDGQGHCFEDFSSVVVAAASLKNDKEPLHPVLSGSTGNEHEEPQQDREDAENHKDENTDEQRPDIEGAEGLEPEDFPEQQPETNCIKAIEDVSEKNQEMYEGRTEDKRQTDQLEEPQAVKKSIEEYRDCAMNFNRFYNRYLLHCCSYMSEVADFYEKSTPFESDLLEAKWRRVQDVDSLPIVSPGAAYFARRYHHYLFGAAADENGYARQYFIGIPGRFLEKEIPDAGESGFVYWQPIKGWKREKGAYGYWIAAIDAHTGDILAPL